MLRRVIAAVVFTAAVGATASAQDVKLPEIEFGRYHALVIGNNDYEHLRNLTTAVGDAEAVATLLQEKYGFRVTKLIDATRLDITGAFNRLRQTLTEKDNLLVYYAGHGILDEEAGEGYWQPVDARSDDDSQWFSNTRLTRYLKAMSAQHVMVVADSCYAGNLTRAATSTVRSGVERDAWTQRMNARRSRTALTSGGLEPVLDRGGGGHSVFARAFLTALEENPDVLFGEELFDRVKGVVVANADQTPEYSNIRYTGDEKGDFLFVPLNINVSVTVRTPPTGRADREAIFWQSIQSSDDPAMFEAYLGRYPAGEFADIAKLKIKAIAKAKEQQTALVVPPKPEIDPVEAEYVAVKDANVRAEPTVRSAKVATLKRGTTVQVAGKVKGRNWYLVERGDKPLGYVFGELLMQPEAARVALAPPPKPPAAAALGAMPPVFAETLRVGTECTYHPFNFRDSDGKLQGYDIDVAKAVGRHLGAEIEFVCQKWDGIIPALLANKFDLIVASMSITERRMKMIDFSDPYRANIGQFIAAKSKGLKFFNADGSVNDAGFKGVRIGVQRATTYDNWIQAKAPGADVVRYDSAEALYLDLKNGRTAAIMTNPMKAYLVFLSKSEGAGFDVVGPQIEATEYFGSGVGIALRKGNEALLKRINKAIRTITDDGSLEKFAQKHFPFTIHPKKWKGTG